MPRLKLAENPARDSRGLGLRAHGLGLAARIAGLESRAWDYSGWQARGEELLLVWQLGWSFGPKLALGLCWSCSWS